MESNPIVRPNHNTTRPRRPLVPTNTALVAAEPPSFLFIEALLSIENQPRTTIWWDSARMMHCNAGSERCSVSADVDSI